MNARVWKLFIATLMVTGMAWAQDEDPGRGVARISLMNGDVSVRRGDSGDLVAAALNAPLVVEDALITGVDARAELQFDWANMIRLAADSEVRLAQFDTNRYLVEVARGLVTFRVEHDSDAEVEISTPCVSVRPLRVGSYRILVREDGECEVTVRSGEADIFTPQGSEHLGPGRTMLARGPASSPEYQMVSEMAHDNWDRWNEDRDRYYDRSDAYRYVDHSVYGAEDLGSYGAWVNVPPYGMVWSPRVDAGWSPYYNGRWSWLDYYGWSWVSYDPWGWAPFHYGRWFYGSPHGWCWYPGGMHMRHAWSPGLVAFVGWGGGGMGVGFGRVGWVPLAPNEPYYPWYGRGFYRGSRNGAYMDNSMRIVNNTNIYNVYRNARVTNAITGMDGSEFGRRGGGHFRAGENDLRNVSLVRGQLPVAPDRNSLRFSNLQAVAAPASRAPANERFVTRRPVPQVERVPFDQQRTSMEQTARRTFGSPAAGRPAEAVSGSRTAVPEAPAARADAPARGQGNMVRPSSPADNGNAGWGRFGPANEGSTLRPSERPAAQSGPSRSVRSAPAAPSVERPSDNGGWRRFEPNREFAPARPSASDTPRTADRPAPVRQVESPQAGPRSEPIRISPPIVRQREAPTMQTSRPSSPPSGSGGMTRAPQGGGGGGGGGRVAASPRAEGGGHGGGDRTQGRTR